MTDAEHRAHATRAARRRYAARGKGAGKRKRGWRRFLGIKALFLYFLGFAFLGIIGVGIVYAMTDIPEPNEVAQSESTIVYWSDGKTELGRFSAENRESVTLADIPQHVRDAVIAAEDRTFYSNSGFDPVGIMRAGVGFLREGGEIVGGGSTITQQYVKNYFLTQDQTWKRKFNELFVSIKVDQQMEKDDILESYLNTIWFGRGLHGVQTASKSYFGKPVSEISVEQGIALAAMLRSPHLYDPSLGPENTERFEDRFQYVLKGMVSMGTLDTAAAAELKPPEVKKEKEKNRYGGPNGYLLQQVRRELLAAGIDEEEIDAGGLRVITTFDRKAQQAAVKAVREERPTENAEGVRIGLAAVKPGDGAVVAMYGGDDAVKKPFNDALDGKQQAGSSFKPFTLAAALEEGISLESRYAGDSPFDPPEIGPPVANQNDADYGEYVDLVQATERSINTAFVDLTMQLGPAKVLDALVRAGVPEKAEDLKANARVTLGLGKVSTVEMADVYATLAAGGRQADWYTVREVTDRGGNVLHAVRPEPLTVFSSDIVADVTYAMTQVVEGEHGSGSVAQQLGRPSAGKTGTHEDLTSWYSGFTPQLAASVSFIRGEGEKSGTESLDGVGGQPKFRAGGYPATIWTAFMKAALEGQEVVEFSEPAEVGEPVNPEPTETPEPEPTEPPEPPGDDDGNGEGDDRGHESGGDVAGGDVAGGNETGGDETGGDESGGDESGGDESGGDESGGNETGDDESGGDEWGGDESGGDESGTDTGGDESGTDTGEESGNDTGGNANGNDNGDDNGDFPWD